MKFPNAYPKSKQLGGVAEKDRPRKGLCQKKRMKKVNRKRGGHAFPKNVDEARREFIRAQPCIILGRCYESAAGYLIPGGHVCKTPVQCCHVKSRGSGGKDKSNMVSMRTAMHDLQGHIGTRQFQTRWGVNLREEAERQEAKYVSESGGSLAPTHPETQK